MERSLRKEVYTYIKSKYKAEPEYLWRRVPNYAVFRHNDNRKWFALMMDIPKNKLGKFDETTVDILNVKLADTLAVELYIQREGIFRGYHISRSNWISILLDGTVDIQEIYSLIDESFKVTSKKRPKSA
ncbi:MAG: MmcQ/YjbR family DNA-binding protein [Clostridia bacterium]|nr:MmcQ/YjbR family DNA-binding protein [Clostridia bacterium]